MKNHHFQKGIGSWEEGSHDNLQQLLSFLVFVLRAELDGQLFGESVDLEYDFSKYVI